MHEEVTLYEAHAFVGDGGFGHGGRHRKVDVNHEGGCTGGGSFLAPAR
jgi:hypothetical protein